MALIGWLVGWLVGMCEGEDEQHNGSTIPWRHSLDGCRSLPRRINDREASRLHRANPHRASIKENSDEWATVRGLVSVVEQPSSSATRARTMSSYRDEVSERQQEQEEEEALEALSASVCSCPPPRCCCCRVSRAFCLRAWLVVLSPRNAFNLCSSPSSSRGPIDRVPVVFFVCACVLIVPRHHPPTNGRQQQPTTTTDRVLRSYYSCGMPVLRVRQSRRQWRHVQRQEARQHDLRHPLLPPMPRPTGRPVRPMRRHLVRRPRRDRSQPSHHSSG